MLGRAGYFIAGAALGAFAVSFAKTEKGQELIRIAMKGGCQLAEEVMSKVETLKEDVEDYLAEAKQAREQEGDETVITTEK